MKKSPFNAKQLKEFKNLLIELRDEVYHKFQNVSKEELNLENGGGDIVDQASELMLHEMKLNMSKQEADLIENIDSALQRIENKTYGICIDSEKPIPQARLKAMPYAKRTALAEEEFNRMKKSKNKVLLKNLYK